jgi:hypothetical protein
MLCKSLISLTIIVIGLSVITVTQAQASELTIPNSIVKFPCSIHNNITVSPQAREEGKKVIKDTGRPPRD